MEDFLNFIGKVEVYGPLVTILVAYIIYNIIKSTLTKIISHGNKNTYETKKRNDR